MRILTADAMTQLFAVTDALGLSREAITVPLEMIGDGAVGRTPRGRIEITLPDSDDLAPFLATLPGRLAGLAG